MPLRSYATGDSSPWENHFAPDVLCVGTDKAELWRGRDAFLSAARARLAEMIAAAVRVTPGDPTITDRDSFVLVADRPTLHLPDGTTIGVRMTLALTRVDKTLVIEQMHMPVPASNEDVLSLTVTV